jgi:hypothetical protein
MLHLFIKRIYHNVQEIINILTLASKWLLRDAIDASGTYRMYTYDETCFILSFIVFFNLSLIVSDNCPRFAVVLSFLPLYHLLRFYTIPLPSSSLGSRDTIGADLLVPLFTMVLINAQLPNVHMILQVSGCVCVCVCVFQYQYIMDVLLVN